LYNRKNPVLKRVGFFLCFVGEGVVMGFQLPAVVTQGFLVFTQANKKTGQFSSSGFLYSFL
jgi:hypothetical protein